LRIVNVVGAVGKASTGRSVRSVGVSGEWFARGALDLVSGGEAPYLRGRWVSNPRDLLIIDGDRLYCFGFHRSAESIGTVAAFSFVGEFLCADESAEFGRAKLRVRLAERPR